MINCFEEVLYRLLGPDHWDICLADNALPTGHEEAKAARPDMLHALNTAFLIMLTGERHRNFGQACDLMQKAACIPEYAEVADFYLWVRKMIHQEVASACQEYPEMAERLRGLQRWLSHATAKRNSQETIEKAWSFFFPEGVGIYGKTTERINLLREKRAVRITELNPEPLQNPGRQVLFTSNILLTIPDKSSPPADLPLSRELREKINHAMAEPQSYWYDHPIQIGVPPAQNEVLYGLQGLSQSVEWEQERGNMDEGTVTCLLSVSVTHCGLQKIAKQYMEEEISRTSGFGNLDVYAFTEADTQALVEEVLLPAALHYKGKKETGGLAQVFGVDGEYGRHYSLLKAIAALWHVLVDPEIKAQFKIDLDQVFPQKILVAQTQASAFEHLRTPLWGARGIDHWGNPVHMDMVAGALVNEGDIHQGLFTPDVVFPEKPAAREDWFFFSTLPQALSTEAEMMTRYDTEGSDGRTRCIERIHVTGGTNGILVAGLRRHRPFTPTFIGRAEDQAYILSVLNREGERLAYVHKDGLIMRHDKETFAQNAIAAASAGKLVGDYLRIILFSKYAAILGNDLQDLKQQVDPFTGCFISPIPISVVMLRFCLKADAMFQAGTNDQGVAFVRMGVSRIRKTINFATGDDSPLRTAYETERKAWDLYYDLLAEMEEGQKAADPFSLKLQARAKEIIARCFIRQPRR